MLRGVRLSASTALTSCSEHSRTTQTQVLIVRDIVLPLTGICPFSHTLACITSQVLIVRDMVLPQTEAYVHSVTHWLASPVRY